MRVQSIVPLTLHYRAQAFEGSAITALHLLIVRHYFELGHSDFVIVLLHSRPPVPP